MHYWIVRIDFLHASRILNTKPKLTLHTNFFTTTPSSFFATTNFRITDISRMDGWFNGVLINLSLNRFAFLYVTWQKNRYRALAYCLLSYSKQFFVEKFRTQKNNFGSFETNWWFGMVTVLRLAMDRLILRTIVITLKNAINYAVKFDLDWSVIKNSNRKIWYLISMTWFGSWPITKNYWTWKLLNNIQ